MVLQLPIRSGRTLLSLLVLLLITPFAVFAQFLSCLMQLPPILSTTDILWLSCFCYPLLRWASFFQWSISMFYLGAVHRCLLFPQGKRRPGFMSQLLCGRQLEAFSCSSITEWKPWCMGGHEDQPCDEETVHTRKPIPMQKCMLQTSVWSCCPEKYF